MNGIVKPIWRCTIVMTVVALAMYGLALFARQEHPAKPIQVWEVAAKTFTEPWAISRTVVVYKFQVGDRRACKAVLFVAARETPLGEVPCDE